MPYKVTPSTNQLEEFNDCPGADCFDEGITELSESFEQKFGHKISIEVADVEEPKGEFINDYDTLVLVFSGVKTPSEAFYISQSVFSSGCDDTRLLALEDDENCSTFAILLWWD